MPTFCRYELRTTDADAARRFYQTLFGHDRAVIWPLHEQALARGARPHWLGHLGVADVEAVADAFVERGATRLGPTRPRRDGVQVAVLRDPGQAVVALATPPPAAEAPSVDVVWHALNAHDAARAKVSYRELFGWELTDSFDLGEHGTFQAFAWKAGEANVGVIGDIAGRAGVHAHWIFFFATSALEPAIAATRAAGGLALTPIVSPDGSRVCVCDDPQGAAFGLFERRST